MTATTKRIGIISLGCDKNRVDTEKMLAQLQEAGHTFTEDIEQAQLVIINTCGFIEAAKQESIDEILQAASYKSSQNVDKILVTGCLSQRYKQELADALPEVDGFLGVNQYGMINHVIERIFSGERVLEFDKNSPIIDDSRVLTTPSHYAYVRIAEGCNNACSYCAIPLIRGKYTSRPIEDILQECQQLLQNGTKEIILVAQDTAYYGKDLYGEYQLATLLEEIAKLGVPWLRVLYTYPERISDTLLNSMQKYDNIIQYLDMPLQHINTELLKKMGRPTTEASIHALIEKINHLGSPFTLRTSLITGFPTETEEQHKQLLHFISKGYFTHLGVFAYSQEEGTRAATLKDQIPEDVKRRRLEELMLAQQARVFSSSINRIGKTYSVLIDEFDHDLNRYVARAAFQTPQADSVIYIKEKNLHIGSFYSCTITDSEGYDFIGEVVHT